MQLLLPKINRLIEAGDLKEALQLAQQASISCPDFKPYSDKVAYLSELIANSSSSHRRIKIALLSERYLNRFGVDRVFIMLARNLVQMGHQVLLIGQRFESSVLNEFETLHIEIDKDTPYIESDIFVAQQIETNETTRAALKNVNFAISSGWPFFESIRALNRLGVETYFYDFGIVPAFGLPEGTQKTLSLLYALKRLYISHATRGCGAISRFVMNSQTAECMAGDTSLSPILLGADHFDELNTRPSSAKASVCELIFLGRCELGNYKQSDLLPSLIQAIRFKGFSTIRIGVLATSEELPEDWHDTNPEIVPLGHVSDIELQHLILDSLGTFVLSSWEGFNLPLAESIALGKPCFVFNVGAHPEVAAHPWLICDDISDMAAKITTILETGTPSFLLPWLGSTYTAKRTWRQTTDQIMAQLITSNKVPFSVNFARQVDPTLLIFIDVTNSTLDPANSGVVRVTRRASSAIQEIAKNGLQIVFVVFDPSLSLFRLLSNEDKIRLSTYNGPRLAMLPADHPKSSTLELAQDLNRFLLSSDKVENKWFLLAEIHHGSHLEVAQNYFASLHGLKMAAIFYDMIPIVHPEFVLDPTFRIGHQEYVKTIACYDLLFPISSHAASQLSGYLLEQSIPLPPIKVIPLGADCDKSQLTDASFLSQSAFDHSSEGHGFVLCVSTLEPRKNHISLIEGFNLLCNSGKNVDNIRLVLVGNRYHGADELYEFVIAAQLANPLIVYKGIVPDNELERLYNGCLFTVYPSLAEGYGLPIVESLLYSKPVVCHNEGSMAELASKGGSVAIDCRDMQAISETLFSLFPSADQHPALLKSLYQEALRIKPKSWSLYGEQMVSSLCIHQSLNLEVL